MHRTLGGARISELPLYSNAHALCADTASFNIDTTSGYYSTIAGVMAGFAFFALFYLVTGYGRERNDRYRQATEALGVAFISLLLIAVAYAVLAGELVSGGRAATIEVIAGVGFAVAAIQLIYAVVLLIAAHETSDEVPVKKFFQVTGAWLCPLTFLLIELGVTDYVETRGDTDSNIVQDAGWILLVLLVIGVIVAWKRRGNARPLWLQVDPSYCALAVGTGAIVGTSVATVWLGQCAAASPSILIAVQIVACATLVNQARALFVST